MARMILLAAFILRIAAAFVWQGKLDSDHKLFLFGDSQTYWVLAEKIAQGKAYDYAGPNSRVFRAPLYPIFLAPATLLEIHRDQIQTGFELIGKRPPSLQSKLRCQRLA